MIKPVPENDPRVELPKRLRDALANYSKHQVLVPLQRDEKVLRSAKEQLKRRQVAARRARWGCWSAAAALVVTLLVWSSLQRAEKRPGPAPNSASIRQKSGDIDGNGVVDIFDAFALARNVKQQQARTTWDINGDGVVDSRDVATIAERAVQLEGRAL